MRLIYSLALRMLRDEGEAANAVHEVLLRLWRDPGLYGPERAPLQVWILTIAQNAAIDRLRRRTRVIISQKRYHSVSVLTVECVDELRPGT